MRFLLPWLIACGGGQDPGLIDGDRDGFPAERDCDDRDPTVHPGANDVWYDGVDSACDGGNDYDQDGDGYAWDAHGGEDCDDLDPLVGPHAEELPYDLVDNDCDPSTPENDLDGDGSRHPVDCDDQDPTVGEGFEERFDDGVDEDCDGHVDGTTLQAHPIALEAPRSLRVTTGLDGEPMLVLSAELVDGHTTEGVDTSVGLAIEPTVADAEPVVFHGGVAGAAEPVGGVDAIASGDTMFFAVASTTSVNETRRLAVHTFQRFGDQLLRVQTTSMDAGSGDPLPHVDVVLDRGDEPWAVMGGADGLAWLADGVGGSTDTDARIGVAVLDAVPPLPLVACDEDGCAQWATDGTDAPPTLTTDDPPIDAPGRSYVANAGLHLLTETTVGAIAWSGGDPFLLWRTEPLVHAAGWSHRGVTYAAGITTDDRVVVTWGDPVFAEPTQTTMTMPSYDWIPREAAIWADDDRMLVAVVADYVDVTETLADGLFFAVLPRASF